MPTPRFKTPSESPSTSSERPTERSAPTSSRQPAISTLIPVQWNVIAYDWMPRTPDAILTNIQRGIGRNRRHGRSSNILMHDGGDRSLGQPRLPTVEATARLLDLCQATSTKFVTPEAWLAT